jgi:hypothetical protein
MEPNQVHNYMTKFCIFAAIWGVGGSMNLATRTDFSNVIADFTEVETPVVGQTIAMIDY